MEQHNHEAGREALTAKGISNLKGIVTGNLKRAKRDHLIEYTYDTVFADLDIIPVKKYVENNQQVFTEKELPLLVNYLIEHPDVHNLCILLRKKKQERIDSIKDFKVC